MKSFKTFLIEQENLNEWGIPRLKSKLLGSALLGGLIYAGSQQSNEISKQEETPQTIVTTTEQPKPDTETQLLPKQTNPVSSDKPQYAEKAIEDYSAHHFIAKHEGFVPNAYKDPGKGIWTIGYGTIRYKDGKPVKEGDKLTHEEALDHLDHHIRNVIHPKLEKSIPTWNRMNPHQKAAITSFAYNLGHNFYGRKNFETISKHLESGNWDGVQNALQLYNKAGGKSLPGLVKRRAEEAELFGYKGVDRELYSTNVNREK
jgi:lysozyme